MIDSINETKKVLEQEQIIFEKGLQAINKYIKSDLCPDGNKKEFEGIINDLLMAGATNDQDKIKAVLSKAEVIKSRYK